MTANAIIMETELARRNRIDYDTKEKMIMENSKKIILLEIYDKILRGDSIIYDNQEECSLSIVSNLHNRKIINIMVVALTQSGKTGTMSALIKNYLNDTTNLIPIENIYIITGLSSCEWLIDTKHRMPKSIQDRVYHRSNLTRKFVDDIKNKKNVLIIIDEIQIAAKEKQTLYKAFKEAGFYDKQYLLKNDIKIIEFSATPDGTIYDLMNWGENALKLKMEPGEGYTSCFDLCNQNRVYQYKDLCGYNRNYERIIKEEYVAKHINEIKLNIDKYKEPLYHIIRTQNGYMGDIVIENFKKYIDKDIKYHKYDKDSDILNINNILKIKPKHHTYIFIKEKLRCAKTLIKKYLGVVYERYTTSPDDAVIIQGLMGRGTGYDDNGKSIYFTNIESIKKYGKLWNSSFEDKTIKWRSKTTKFKDNKLSPRETFNNPLLIDGMSTLTEDCIQSLSLVIKKFKTQEEVKEYYNTELKDRFGGRGPNKRKPNEKGFYEATIKTEKKVWSWNEIDDRVYIGAANNDYWYYPCYEDTTDKNTLEFWLIHR